MPLYEYTCRSCQSDFEALVPASERDGGAAPCPTCGTTKVARKISLMANPIIKSNANANAISCGAPTCCGGGCAIN